MAYDNSKKIGVGTTANDKKGDSLRTAFIKVNNNFEELYTKLGLLTDTTLNLGAFEFAGSTMTTTDSTPIVIDQATTVTSDLTVGGDIVPNVANGGNLGSLAKPFRSLYVSNNTIFLGGVPLNLEPGTNELRVNNVPISQNITYTDIPNAPTDVSDLTDTEGLLGGGGGGLPLANGTSNFDIATANGNAAITANAVTYTFGTDSKLSLPGLENGTPVVDFFSTNPDNHLVRLSNDWTLNIEARALAENQGHLNLIAGQNTRLNINGEGSNVEIVVGDGETSNTWNFDTTGNVTIPGGIYGLGTIRIDNLATGISADIELYAADNILLQAKDFTVAGDQREGGDININGGDGSPADVGDQGGTGGDIQIFAGLGGNGASGSDGGDGGFIRIYSGNGGSSDSGTGAAAAAGGEVHIRAGTAGNNGGNNALGANGGKVRIQAGDSSSLTTGMGSVEFDSGLGTDNGVDPRVAGEYRFGYRSGNGTEQLIYKEAIAALAFTPKPLAFLGSASAAGAGARAFINDSNAVASGNFGAIAVGTGNIVVPVYSDGTNWRIG